MVCLLRGHDVRLMWRHGTRPNALHARRGRVFLDQPLAGRAAIEARPRRQHNPLARLLYRWFHLAQPPWSSLCQSRVLVAVNEFLNREH
jgi:hypothetical protein